MRHHIVFKFIAVFLCAACLMCALGSGAGLLAMTELGLRDRTLEEAQAASHQATANSLANELAVRYASRELGGASESLVDNYYGNYWIDTTFNWDQVGYTILDAGGNVLEELEMEQSGSVSHYSFELSGDQYINILTQMTQEEYEEIHYPATEPVYPSTEPYPELTAYNAVPVEGCKIAFIHVDYMDGYSSDYEAGGSYLGVLSYYTSNQLEFQVQSDYADIARLFEDLGQSIPVGMQFQNTYGEIVLEIGHPGGILEELSDNHGNLGFGNLSFILRPLDEAVQLPSGNVYDAIPPEGQSVTRISVAYADGFEESAGGSPDIGWIGYDEEGNVVFTASSEGILEYRTEPVTYISFHEEYGNLVYEASDINGVGFFSVEENTLVFRGLDAGNAHIQSPVVTENIYIYDDVPPQGYPVVAMELWLKDAPRGIVIENDGNTLGIADHDADGNVIFRAENWKDFVFSKPAEVVYILMTDNDGRLLYEAKEDGVPTGSGRAIGMFAYDSQGDLVFTRSTVTAAAMASADPAAQMLPSETAATMEETFPADTVSEATGAVEETIPGIQETDTADVTAAAAEETETTLPAMAANETVGETAAQVTEPEMTEVPAEPTTEESIPMEHSEQADVTEPGVAAEGDVVPSTLPPTEYETALAEDSVRVFGYYDHSAGQNMMVEYTYEETPPYTVEIVMGPGALVHQYEWVLMGQVYHIQDYLIPMLVLSLLLFAITAVYLCCSAGRRPGTTQVRANGLNCLSLDLYLAIAVGGAVCCFLAMVEGGDYLLRQDVQTGMLFAILCAYAACLLVVGFCFAFAAQVKTPGGYWWHNSICGRSLKVIAWLWNKFVDLCGWLWDKFDTKIEPALVRLFKALWKLTKFFVIQLKNGLLWLCRKLLQGCDWLSRVLGRFLSMLPLTWQFLLIGFTLVMFLYIMIRTYKVGYILLGFGVFFGVILYAASAFGILLENAKRMRKGDLDSKVDDKLLIGSFRDFADELNGLADVAVVAAQKQLKSERMKTELITNVSHDIKTPLTSIINYVDLMEKPHSPEEQAAYLEVLSRQSQRLKKLIDDLMEMSKASTGNMAVEITRVDAAEAVNQALGEFADKLDRAQLIPVFRQPEKDILMMADGRLVWRVLSNVLSNAVKYALPGTRVYIDLMELEGKVVLSLKNISREPLNVSADELLERFVRGDTARNTEGSGLGLNIAQSLMELQRGKLELLVDGDLFKVTLIFPSA